VEEVGRALFTTGNSKTQSYMLLFFNRRVVAKTYVCPVGKQKKLKSRKSDYESAQKSYLGINILSSYLVMHHIILQSCM
jgi:hypothetical protein